MSPSRIVLSALGRVGYGYNAAVEHFGDRLRRLRKRRDLRGPLIAQRALGETATPKQIRSFANYLSRLERGQETNPSLLKLVELARGFGDASVADFLQHLSRQTDADLAPDESVGENVRTPPDSPEVIHADAAPAATGFDDATALADQLFPVLYERLVFKFATDAEAVRNALGLTATVPRARRKKSRRRRRRTPNR